MMHEINIICFCFSLMVKKIEKETIENHYRSHYRKLTKSETFFLDFIYISITSFFNISKAFLPSVKENILHLGITIFTKQLYFLLTFNKTLILLITVKGQYEQHSKESRKSKTFLYQSFSSAKYIFLKILYICSKIKIQKFSFNHLRATYIQQNFPPTSEETSAKSMKESQKIIRNK